jgi:hypothetical protein
MADVDGFIKCGGRTGNLVGSEAISPAGVVLPMDSFRGPLLSEEVSSFEFSLLDDASENRPAFRQAGQL